MAVASAPSGEVLASGGKDAAVRLWEIKPTDQRKEPAPVNRGGK
jgi:hypothetical protein